eukprot:m.295154 g.295154  ORF g.295154 m.295154 type:complete len:418 (-) comp27172_c1_seq1:25-1278(-)
MAELGPAVMVCGLMSGTSADGIDVAFVRIRLAQTTAGEEDASGTPTLRLVRFAEVPWAEADRQLILGLMDPARVITLRELGRADVRLGRAFAEACVSVRGDLPLDLVASHGQTLHHDPDGGSTTQIGQPAVIAAVTRVTTVADFRVADMARGGQGAPLTSTFDYLLLRPQVGVRALQNIGGIGNVTFVPALQMAEAAPVAFDTGPGNCLIDLAAASVDPTLSCDVDGRLAESGSICADLLTAMLSHPYFGRPVPKTTGREVFSGALFAEWKGLAATLGCTGADLVATVTELTAQSIVQSYRLSPQSLTGALTEVVVSGGGGKNPLLMARLRQAIQHEYGDRVSVRGHADVLGEMVEPGALPPNLTVDDAKEAMVFCLLGWLTLHGRPGSVPSCTGADAPAILGAVSPGANFEALLLR